MIYFEKRMNCPLKLVQCRRKKHACTFTLGRSHCFHYYTKISFAVYKKQKKNNDNTTIQQNYHFFLILAGNY